MAETRYIPKYWLRKKAETRPKPLTSTAAPSNPKNLYSILWNLIMIQSAAKRITVCTAISIETVSMFASISGILQIQPVAPASNALYEATPVPNQANPVPAGRAPKIRTRSPDSCTRTAGIRGVYPHQGRGRGDENGCRWGCDMDEHAPIAFRHFVL